MGELEIFATRIKELRESFGMTQKEFSQYVGIKQQTLSGYERGLMKPPLDIITEIAKKCSVSIDWLCGLEKENKNSLSINTYADIICMLFEISKYVYMVPLVDDRKEPGDNCDAMLCFTDKQLDEFLVEWAQAYNVRYNSQIKGDITKTMYDTWVNSKIEEFKKYKTKRKKD